MHIANPIYDVVFKYMMEDRKVARMFITAIIGEEVLELDFCPQELTMKYGDESRTVIRLDFLAKIKVPGGQKVVIIEMQKAQYSSDIKRFRRYLGSQYESDRNIYTDEKQTEHAMPIYCIFFLGKGLDIPGVPVLTVTNLVKDRTTGKELHPHSEFIDSLHHKSWIVQIADLKEHRRNDLEKLLSIFDQSNVTNSSHFLNVKEDDFPEEYRHIIRRLKQAAEIKDIEVQMRAEDELIGDFQNMERQIAARDEIIEEKNKEVEDQAKALEEKNRALEEKARALEEKNKALAEALQEIERLKNEK